MRPLRHRFLLLFLAVALPAAAQEKGKIVFDETEHGFGQVEEGVQARHVFTFRNEGTAPLRLKNVRPSCGCTTPEWTQDPVAPGATGQITVVYNSEGRPGTFRKSVNVESDGEPHLVVLRIHGDVRGRALADTYSQGSLRIDQDDVEIGTVARGTNGVHRFQIQNGGTRPLRFTKIVRAPDNVQVTLPAAPLFNGDVAQLTVTVDTGGLQAGATFDYAIAVETDDQTQPVKSFRIKGRVAGGGTH
jgi:hypothetical protein